MVSYRLLNPSVPVYQSPTQLLGRCNGSIYRDPIFLLIQLIYRNVYSISTHLLQRPNSSINPTALSAHLEISTVYRILDGTVIGTSYHSQIMHAFPSVRTPLSALGSLRWLNAYSSNSFSIASSYQELTHREHIILTLASSFYITAKII